MKVIRICLAEYLDAHGITRYELSRKTGISYLVIDGYYKNKVTRLDTFNFAKIIDALDCDLSDILAVDEK